MTPDRLAALRTFFESSETLLPNVVEIMCARLLSAGPDEKSLCDGDLRERKLHFLQMLKRIIELTRSSYLWPVGALTGQASIPLTGEFSSYFEKAGVTPEHFEKMKIVLPQVCEEQAPAEFTAPVAEALDFIFDVLSQSLKVSSESAIAGNVRKSLLAYRETGAPLQDPASYFDYVLPNESVAARP